MVEGYKILKSLMKNLRRLVLHLGTAGHNNNMMLQDLPAIATLVSDALQAMTADGDFKSLAAMCSRKD
jgi:hypothetical protein